MAFVYRYATFLELFALLDRSERLGSAREERLKILGYVAHHEEDFFGRYRRSERLGSIDDLSVH